MRTRPLQTICFGHGAEQVQPRGAGLPPRQQRTCIPEPCASHLLSTAVLNQCNYVVLDEADRMIDLGFEPQVRFRSCHSGCQWGWAMSRAAPATGEAQVMACPCWAQSSLPQQALCAFSAGDGCAGRHALLQPQTRKRGWVWVGGAVGVHPPALPACLLPYQPASCPASWLAGLKLNRPAGSCGLLWNSRACLPWSTHFPCCCCLCRRAAGGQPRVPHPHKTSPEVAALQTHSALYG